MERPAPDSVDEPIIRRLDKLKEQYREFIADPAARVLLWRFAEDETRMLEALVQQNAITAESGDAILDVPCAFELRFEYGIIVIHDLDEVLDEVNKSLGDSGPPQPVWIPPQPPGSLERRSGAPAPDQQYMVKALHSLYEHMQPQAKHLTLVIEPREISDDAAWFAWLDDLIPLLDDEKVRYVLPHDGSVAPLLALGQRYRGRVMSLDANLDMPGAFEEIAAKTPDANLPSGQFRSHFVKLGNAVGKKDLAGARMQAPPALAIAQSQNWPHLEFAVFQALATGELGLGDSNAAMLSFTKAGDAASRTVAGGAEWAHALVLQSRLGMGAVAVTMGAWQLGARLYGVEALPSAAKAQDKLAQLDCLRMAAYCEERGGQYDAAWEHLKQAMGIGRELAQPEREASTLAFVGDAMLRICQTERYNSERYGVEQQMVSLLGPNWRERCKPQSPPPPGDAPSPLEAAAPPPGLPTAGPPNDKGPSS